MLKLDDINRGRVSDPTPTQRKVLEFILKRPEEAVFLTATRLADRLDISDTSIVRLAQTLGYAGYPELRKRIRDLVRPRLTTVDRMDRTTGEIGSVEDVLARVMLKDISNLRTTYNDLDRNSFREAVEELDTAQRIYCIGLRSTHCLAVFLTSALRYLKKNVTLLSPGTGEMWEQIRDLGGKDLVVGFSFPRYTKTTVQVLEHARERGSRVIAITDSDLSPLAEYADITLTVPYEMDSFMESFTAALSLINSLVTGLAFKGKKNSLEILKEIEATWARQGVYWKE